VIKASLGERLDPLVHRLFPYLFRRPIDPNALTICGALVSTLAAVAFASGRFALAGLLVLLGGAFDLVDGVVARHFGTTSRFGAFLDSTLDRWVDMVLLLGICVHFAARGEAGTVLLSGAALVISALVSYAKARAELVLPRFEVGLLERGERVGLLAAGAILGLLIPALWVITLGSGITVAQRIALAHREMESMDAADRTQLGEPTG
jgi:phosphatidylinositol phosphate synthase